MDRVFDAGRPGGDCPKTARPYTVAGIHSRRRSSPMQQWLESPADDRIMSFHW